MVLLKPTVCLSLLLVISFAEAQITCTTSCTAATAEKDSLDLTCSGAGFALSWHKNDKHKSSLAVRNLNHEADTITGQADAEAPEGNPWFCYGKATNGAEQSCTPLPCKVLYSVRNVITWPLLFVSPGEEIKCSAEGNPEPKFSWESMDEGGSGTWTAIPGATSETFDAQLSNGTSTHLRCVAKNTIKGQEHVGHSAGVIVSKDGALIRNAIIGSVVALIVIVIIVVGIIHVKCPQYLPCKLSDIVKCDGG